MIFDWTREWVLARGMRHWASESVDSTNSYAKNDETHAPHVPGAAKVGEPSLYLARAQSAGRGRGTNVWIDSGGSLLSSWSFRLAKPAQPITSPLVGLALHDSLRKSFPGLTSLSLKAPNDVFLGDKKVAGLLIETVITGGDVKIIVGLGLNVFTKPSRVSTSGALAEHADVTRDAWFAFLDALRDEFSRALASGQERALKDDVRARLREALNAFPLLEEPVAQVDEQGQIQTSRGFVHWHQL